MLLRSHLISRGRFQYQLASIFVPALSGSPLRHPSTVALFSYLVMSACMAADDRIVPSAFLVSMSPSTCLKAFYGVFSVV